MFGPHRGPPTAKIHNSVVAMSRMPSQASHGCHIKASYVGFLLVDITMIVQCIYCWLSITVLFCYALSRLLHTPIRRFKSMHHWKILVVIRYLSHLDFKHFSMGQTIFWWCQRNTPSPQVMSKNRIPFSSVQGAEERSQLRAPSPTE
ncbi:unnamed protein product [Periconia digitata]|uniref:Uncharacterized protein n=1 Tax=Periconia digitata TaxID=1303443 RepID=A0A9W4UNY9_9PLEO|nr:unnamed protein product [Periconia digitata]